MIVLEFKDYSELKYDIDKVNEGWVGNFFKKMKEKLKMWLKGTGKEIDDLIAPSEINDMIDKKTGQLVGNIVNHDDIADVEKPIADIFQNVKTAIPTGKFFLTGLQFLQDALESTDNLYKQEIASKQLARSGDANKSIGSGISDALRHRGKEFDRQLRVNVQQLKNNMNAEVKQLLAKVDKAKMPTAKLIAETRFRNAQNILMILEYLFKKRRWNIEDLTELSDEMVNSYKETIKLESELTDKLKQAENEINASGTEPESTPEGTQQGQPELQRTNIKEEITTKYDVEQIVKYKTPNNEFDVKILEFTDTDVIIISIANGKEGNKWAMSYETFKERTA